MITFERLGVGISYMHIRYISREYGSSSYIKVVGSKSRSQEQKRLKISIPTMQNFNSSSVKHRAMKFVYSMGFSAKADRMCDRHLCYVTGSEHA